MSRKNLDDVRKLLSDDPEWLRPMVQALVTPRRTPVAR